MVEGCPPVEGVDHLGVAPEPLRDLVGGPAGDGEPLGVLPGPARAG